jgi:hypothetical protein
LVIDKLQKYEFIKNLFCIILATLLSHCLIQRVETWRLHREFFFLIFLPFDYENKIERKKNAMNPRISQTLPTLACKEKIVQAREVVVATSKIFMESSQFRFKALVSSPTFQDSPICSHSCVRVWSLLFWFVVILQ